MSVWRAGDGEATARQTGVARGILLREGRDELVVQASPAEVERFGARRGAEVTLVAPQMAVRFMPPGSGMMATTAPVNFQDTHTTRLPPTPGSVLYDEYGRAVAVVDQVHVNVEQVDVTDLGSVSRQFIAGRRHIDIRCVGIPAGFRGD